MAIPFIRYQVDFATDLEGFTGSEYSIIIRDAALFTDKDFDFCTDSAPTINYPTEDDQFQDSMKGSNCVIPFIVENSVDQTFIDELIADQEGNFFVEILKNSSAIWKGVVAQDESVVENRAFPYVFEITAIDGITELKEISGLISPPGPDIGIVDNEAFHTVLQAVVFMLNQTRTALLYESTDAMLVTGARWFEIDMVTDVDPLANMAYFAQTIEWDFNNEGIQEFESYFDILKGFMERLNLRIFMNNGLFTIYQTNELRFDNIDLFTYAKNYQLTDPDPQNLPTGVISSNVSTSLKVDLINDGANPINAGVNYNHETGDVFQYLGAVREATIGYDFEQSLFYRAISEEMFPGPFDTEATVIIGTGYNLNFSGNTIITSLSGVGSFPLIGTITMDITIKVGTNYWDGAAWTATVSVAKSSIQAWNFTTNFNPVYPISFVIPAPPAQGGLEISIGFTTPAGITVVSTETTLDVSYQDSSGNPVKIGFTATNAGAPNSSIVLDLGDTIIGDRPGNIQFRQWRTWNGLTYKASEFWQINQVGSQRLINEMLVEESVKVRKIPIRKWELELKGDYLPFITVMENGTQAFIFNGGSFNLSTESWSVVLLEITVPVGSISLGSFDSNPNLGGVYNKAVQDNQSQQNSLGLKAYDASKLAVTDEVASGTISTIGVVAGFIDDVIRAGDVVSITDLEGHTEFLDVTVDLVSGGDLTFTSTTLSFAYPIGSQINLSSEEAKLNIVGILDFTITGGTFVTRYASGRTIVELTQSNTYTLPELDNVLKKSILVTFKNISGGEATVQRAGTDTIDGNESVVLADNETLTVYLTSTEYRIIF